MTRIKQTSLVLALILGPTILFAGQWTAAAIYAVASISDDKTIRREIWLYNDTSTTVIVQRLDADTGTRQHILPRATFKAKADDVFLGPVAQGDVVTIAVHVDTGQPLGRIATQGSSIGWMKISGTPVPMCISVAAEPPANVPGRWPDDTKPCSRATR